MESARSMVSLKKPYVIREPTVVSFSGGRSSAYMLHHVLDANDGLPDDSAVVFANTGKELPATLDFVRDCSINWGVDITWLEMGKDRRETLVVDYETASRNGEPFDRLIRDKGALPNGRMRFCTSELKVNRIKDYRPDILLHMIGIRADEPRRWSKNHNHADKDRRVTICPMYQAGVSAEDVGRFWEGQPFDLQLPNINGKTDMGNCDLCFLKGRKIRRSIVKHRPDLAQWWINQEEKMGYRFDNKIAVVDLVGGEQTLDLGFDESFACFCGD